MAIYWVAMRIGIDSGVESAKTRSQDSLDLVQNSVLSTSIPLANTSSFEILLRDSLKCLKRNEPPLASVPQRHVLFFDETVDIYVILQIPFSHEIISRSHLKRLNITVEAQVLNSQYENCDVSPAHETIYTQSIQDIETPLFSVQAALKIDEITTLDHSFTAWKTSIFLDRPRLRFQSPSVIFSAKATISSGENQDSIFNSDYLSSQIPSSVNMLEAFGSDSSIEGVKPRLSALRVSRVTPSIHSLMKSTRLLKSKPHQSIKICPAINSKVKYSKLITISNNIGVVASLEIEITPFADCELIIHQVQLNFKDGRVEDLFTKFGLSLPIVSSPMNSVTLTFFLSPNEPDVKLPVRDLEICISASAKLSNGCQPPIEMYWTSPLSFTPAVNPEFGTVTSSIKRSHKPSQLSIDIINVNDKTVSNHSVSTHSEAFTPAPISIGHQLSPSLTDFGIIVTIASSSSPIYPGIPFTWDVFILNRSDRLRKLSLTVLPNRYGSEESYNQKSSLGYLEDRDFGVADAVVEENLVFSIQKSSCRAAEIICLTTNLEIGPLTPMACHEIELKFIALDVGVIIIESVRVLDLDTQIYLDIKDLPIVFVSQLSSLQ